MRARRTHQSSHALQLPGGTEDNDLWIYTLEDDHGNTVIASVWVPTDAEREKIARGENIRLLVWGRRHPPVAIDTTDEPIGKKPNAELHKRTEEGGGGS